MTGPISHSEQEGVLFREVQRFKQPWVWLVLGLVLLHSVVYIGFDHGNWLPSSFILAGIALFAMFRLTIEVDERELRVRFAPFVNKRIPHEELKSASAVEYHPLKEYAGWGIRRGKEGWAYTTHGTHGVRVRTKSGVTFLVGSQRPDELVDTLRATASKAT